ncbi:D-aminoacyl-tRNA deacylase [Fluviicola sp.]|uniref:D-aminoacyl-tRNA deacylase n=1 Tax=Fluviicola sp. TaxID=1917219 RepID=UPI0031E31F57
MRLVIQRVSQASVRVEDQITGAINQGLLVLLGIEQADSEEDTDWLLQKLIQMRIFSDAEGKMNCSLQDINGELLVVSQFTLHASTKKGNRPSFIAAARPEQAIPLYESFIRKASQLLGKKVETGIFGADMKVALINDGPVTITIDSKNRE